MKTQSSKKIFVSILILVALLIATFGAMRYVNGPEFQSGLHVLFGSPGGESRVWNWCPAQTSEVIMQGIAYREDTQISVLCRVEIEPLELDQKEIFYPLAEAIVADKKVLLEANTTKEIFRVAGLPFRSSKLTKFVKDQSPNPR